MPIDIGRLAQAVQRARLVLRTPRQNRFDMVRQYVGRRWSDEGAPQTVPCNLISQYVGIVGRKLIAHNPRVMLSTWSHRARPVVKAMQDWANKEIERIDLVDTLSECVLDGLFSIGVCKVALATPGDAALAGWKLQAGQPFAEAIDLDDFVFDVHCRKLREAGFMGHRYRVPLATIRESKLYSRDRKTLSASYDQLYNMEGDERIGILGRTTLGGDEEEYEDFVDLWEIYLPRHKVVITLRDDNLTGASTGGDVKADPHFGKALRIQKWLGPDEGPYHILGFGRVPGNPMPKAPVQDLYDLHISINNMHRKLLRQAHDYKRWTAVQGGAASDGSRIMEVNDGDIIRVDNPDKMVTMEASVPNQQLYMLFAQMKELFSWLSGNLDVMGGLSPQGDTATQENLLNANSSAAINEMQQRTVDFSSSVIKSLCWFWHHHPQQVMKSEYQVPGQKGMSVVRRVHPFGQGRGPRGLRRLARDHSWDDMAVKVDPYSMPHLTPQQRLQMLNQIVQQTYIPMAQIAQQQGVSLDYSAYLDKVGQYMDDPDLGEILTVGEPPQQSGDSGGGGGAPPTAGPPPATTTRNYVRRSLGKQGDQNQILQRLGAGGGQNGQGPQPGQNGQGQMPRPR